MGFLLDGSPSGWILSVFSHQQALALSTKMGQGFGFITTLKSAARQQAMLFLGVLIHSS